MGWFFGFKFHLIINDKGEILDFVIIKGNVDNRKPLKNMNLYKNTFRKLYGDKGYISKDLFEKLVLVKNKNKHHKGRLRLRFSS